MSRLRLTHAVVIILAALLATLTTACTPQIRESPPPSAMRPAPENFPGSAYEQAMAQGKQVYRVLPKSSLVVITVRRGGSLARFGHDHVVASHATEGYISAEENRADLYVPLNELAVDETALRTEAGLNTQPSESDIAGTRTNMLDKVLESQKFPYALISVSGIEKREEDALLNVAITLHGVTRKFDTPAQIETEGNEMSVNGSIEFNQSDFGIVPFSVFGGALQVQDQLSLRFKILARRSGG